MLPSQTRIPPSHFLFSGRFQILLSEHLYIALAVYAPNLVPIVKVHRREHPRLVHCECAEVREAGVAEGVASRSGCVGSVARPESSAQAFAKGVHLFTQVI